MGRDELLRECRPIVEFYRDNNRAAEKITMLNNSNQRRANKRTADKAEQLLTRIDAHLNAAPPSTEPTDEQAAAAARIIAASSLIDAPKLGPESWLGLGRSIARAILNAAPQPSTADNLIEKAAGQIGNQLNDSDLAAGVPDGGERDAGRFAQPAPAAPRFANVSCSQCGQDFGPGDHGYSHCIDHAALAKRRKE